MMQRTKRLAVYLMLGSSLFYQCEPGESYNATLNYINDTADTIYFNPLRSEDIGKSPLFPNEKAVFDHDGIYSSNIMEASPSKLRYFDEIRYNSDSCDLFKFPSDKGDEGPLNLNNYEIKTIGEDNFDMTFRFTEELKKRAKPCE